MGKFESQKTERVEQREKVPEDWHILKREAALGAKQLLDQISDFEEMSFAEQKAEISTLLKKLSDKTDKNYNNNRFIARVLSNHLAVIEHQEKIAKLEEIKTMNVAAAYGGLPEAANDDNYSANDLARAA